MVNYIPEVAGPGFVMEAPIHLTREAWLHFAQRMAPMFEKVGASLPAQLRIALDSLQAVSAAET
jgi:hypothetical protein